MRTSNQPEIEQRPKSEKGLHWFDPGALVRDLKAKYEKAPTKRRVMA
jgi:hypothetical protein